VLFTPITMVPTIAIAVTATAATITGVVARSVFALVTLHPQLLPKALRI